MTKRFQKAYDSLVRAFFEDTLAKGTCIACACGNIIFDAVGERVTAEDMIAEDKDMARCEKRDRAFELWGNKRNMRQGLWKAEPQFEGVINEAGYTTEEFAAIENAFEGNTRIPYHMYRIIAEKEVLEDQYRGLCAVVDVLLELDKDSGSPDELKQKFREHPKLATA